jgi:hypothetical protein
MIAGAYTCSGFSFVDNQKKKSSPRRHRLFSPEEFSRQEEIIFVAEKNHR